MLDTWCFSFLSNLSVKNWHTKCEEMLVHNLSTSLKIKILYCYIFISLTILIIIQCEVKLSPKFWLVSSECYSKHTERHVWFSRCVELKRNLHKWLLDVLLIISRLQKETLWYLSLLLLHVLHVIIEKTATSQGDKREVHLNKNDPDGKNSNSRERLQHGSVHRYTWMFKMWCIYLL